MTEICSDNRFEIIADYKRRLIEGTNIETKPEEMAVLDSILFRFWQMGWLREQETVKTEEGHAYIFCGACHTALSLRGNPKPWKYCPICGRKVKW